MSSAHSPGPWHYRAMLTASENHTGFRIYDSRGNWALAEVQPGDQDGIEGEANARLIAAAPELLKALRGVLHLFSLLERHPEVTRYFEPARAAIKKATEA